ncbi:amidohydrolase family protein [Halocola ammonii]
MKAYLSLAVLFLALVSCSSPEKYELVIKNVRLFDGHEDRGVVNIAINADTIAAISTEELVGDSAIDGTGKFIVPGLVNAHVHASKVEQLQEGFQYGILTLLNMHTGLEAREQEWKKLTADSAGFSKIYGSGHAATVPGGHPTQFSPGMETITDSLSIEDWVDHRIAQNVDYIKIIHTTRGWMDEPSQPTLSYEQVGEIIDYSHSKGYKVLVHATTIEEMVEIAKYKPDGFAHMLDFKSDYPVPESYYQTLQESGAFIVTTGGISLKPMEGFPPFVVNWVSENILDAEERAEIINQYHEHGILLVAGTDSQEGQMNFGEDYFLELDLYKMSGMSNEEILRAATGNAAKAFDLPIGEVKPGSPASFLVLLANPLENISNLRKIDVIWKDGQNNTVAAIED